MWKPDLTGQDKTINPLSAFRFALVLCLVMLIGSILPFPSSNPAVPAFYSFLPMSFYFVGLWQKSSARRADQLERRIKELEAKLAERGAA